MQPPRSVGTIRHFANLYAQCQAALESRDAPIGVLRVNNVLLGMTCVALGLLDTNDPVDPACNIKSYLPSPR